jgi:uncharacterized membrane protein YqjE
MTADSPVASSLEHLISASHSMLSKRIDLVLLEAQEIVSRSLTGAALTGLCMLLAAGAWFALAGAAVLLLIPESASPLRLFAFGLANCAGALGCALMLARNGRSSRTRAPRVSHATHSPETTAVIENI